MKFRENLITFFFLFLILIIYLLTLFPGPGGRVNAGDSMKWQFIGKILGTPHPPGYPLFILLSAIFSKIFFPLPLFTRVNLISIFFAILTLFFLFKVMRQIGANIFSSLIVTSIFALGKIFWSQATEAEVYTINSFFIILIIYFLMLWKDKRYEIFLSLSLFFSIFSLSNHITILFFFPSIFIFILLISPKSLFGKRTILFSAISLLILSSLYLFLVWRSNRSIYSEFPIQNIRDFTYFVSGGVWKRSLNPMTLNSIFSGLSKFFSSIPSNLTFSSLIILASGIFALFKNFKVLILLLLSSLLFLFFSASYSIIDFEVNYIPVYLFMAIFTGCGMNFLLNLKASKFLWTLMIFVFSLIPFLLFIENYKELKIKESYWGEWIKIVFSNFKRETIFIPDYINYDQDMALSYGVFGLDYIKNKNFVIGENFYQREKIIEDYLLGKEIYLKGFKLERGMKIVCFDEGIALGLSQKFKVKKRVISDKITIPYFRIMKNGD